MVVMKQETGRGGFGFGRGLRLHGQREFAGVLGARCRKVVGAMAVCGRPNGLGYSRLGLSVSRRVGGAVVRVRVKRMLREAFRLGRGGWPVGYDWVVVVRGHEAMGLAAYQRALGEAVLGIEGVWRRRLGRGGGS